MRYSLPKALSLLSFFSFVHLVPVGDIPANSTDLKKENLSSINVGDTDLEKLTTCVPDVPPFDITRTQIAQTFNQPAGSGIQSVYLNQDGTRMFIGTGTKEILEYDLTTGYDLTTATFNGDTEKISIEEVPLGINFNTDGTKFFVLEAISEELAEYTLSTAFDISTATYEGDSENLDLSSIDNSPKAFAFKPDGTQLYFIGGSGSKVYTVNLSTAYDVSTGVDAGASATFDFSGIFSGDDLANGISMNSLSFNDDGAKMFLSTQNTIYEYNLSTPYDISTATYNQVRFNFFSGEVSSTFVSLDGRKLFNVVPGVTTGMLRHDLNEKIAPEMSSTIKSSGSFIRITFSENITLEGTTFSDFTAQDALGTNLPIDDIRSGTNTISLSIATLPDAAGDVTINYINNNGLIIDQNCNQLATGSILLEDETEPRITGFTKDSDTQLTVTIDEKVQTNGTNPTDFVVTDADNNSFAVSVQQDGTIQDNQIVLTVADLSTANEFLRLVYTNNNAEITDFAGNELRSTGSSGVLLTLPPKLSTALRDSDTQITLSYNVNVETNSTNPDDFTVTDGVGTTFAVTAQEDGTAGDTDIVLTVEDFSSAVGDLNITYVNNNDEITANGVSAETDNTGVTVDLDNTAPTLVSAVIDTDTQITLMLSEAIQTNAGNPTDFTVVDAGNTPFVVSAQADGTAQDTRIVLTVADFSGATLPLTITYTNNNDEITDFGGNALATDGTGVTANLDVQAPVFENSTPAASNITNEAFSLSTDIDETGTIYYVLVPDGDTEPTVAELKAGQASGGGAAIAQGSQTVTTDPFSHDFSVTGLSLGTAYDLYVFAEDDAGTPNEQANPEKLDILTTSNIVITFDDQSYTASQNVGNPVTLQGMTFTYREQGQLGNLIVKDDFSASGLALNASNNNQTSGDQLQLSRDGGGHFGIKSLHISGSSSLGALRISGYIGTSREAFLDITSPTDGQIDLTDPEWSNIERVEFGGFDKGLVVNFDDITIDLVSTTDITPPSFESSKPVASNITTEGFTIETDIDEAGTIFYAIYEENTFLLSASRVKQGKNASDEDALDKGSQTVSTGDFTHDFVITGLASGTAYDLYVTAEDATGNIQAATRLDVSTLAVLPIFESEDCAVVIEGNTTVLDVNANDGSGGATDANITYSLSGTDAADFSIDMSTGALTFASAPDASSPADDDTDNVYELTVTASNGGGMLDQDITVIVARANILTGNETVIQLGNDLVGDSGADNWGNELSFSADGSVLAVAAPLFDANGPDAGLVKLFRYDGSDWVQLGADLKGEAFNDYFGTSVSLSSDGSIVAIGAPNNDGNGSDSGEVKVYQYDGTDWLQLGGDINGESLADESGTAVSLSASGKVVAIGAPYNRDGAFESGHVRVYEFDGTDWLQIGADIDGEAQEDRSGRSVSLSDDGKTLAIGASGNDGSGPSAGHTRILRYNGTDWVQLGADIDGEATNDFSGGTVQLSADGSIVAIGATGNDGTGANAGHVRVFQFNGTAWTQMGADIDGEASQDSFGSDLSLSDDGKALAVGSVLNGGNGQNAGHVRVYRFDGTEWVQSGEDIDGAGAFSRIGIVSLSGDARFLAIGASSSTIVSVYEMVPPTPPVFENSTPSASNITETAFTLTTDIDESGTIYYVIVPNDAEAPSSEEVKNGEAEDEALDSGSQAVATGDFTHDFSIADLVLGTDYDVYVVAEDENNFLQTEPAKLEVKTLDETAPVFESDTPTASPITIDSFTLNAAIDEDGTVYFVVVASGEPAPTSAEVKAGQASGGAAPLASGNETAMESQVETAAVTGLTSVTNYDVYLVAEDDESTPNLQDTPVKLVVKTLSNPPAFTSTAVVTVNESEDYSYTITTSDPDAGEIVNILGTTLPSWLSIENTSPIAVSTFAGNGTSAITDGTGTAAEFEFPLDVAIDNAGNLYVADFTTIRKITPAGVVTTLFTATEAIFTSLVVDASGTVFAAEGGEGAIRIVKISPAGVRSEFVGGSGQNDFGDAEGTGTAARFAGISGMAFDAAGNLFVGDGANHKIRKITPAGVVTTFVGSGEEGEDDGNGTLATFNFPQGLAIDSNGNLYVSDTQSDRIRKITPAGEVSTLAGSGTEGSADGTGSAAEFDSPRGLAIDAADNILVADRNNSLIRKITPEGVVTTLAGSGEDAFADGTATEAAFDGPFGLAINSNGDIFVADGGNERIRKIVIPEPSFELSGDPLGRAGTHNVTLTADDGNGGTQTQEFVITVVDDIMPIISGVALASDRSVDVTFNEFIYSTNSGNGALEAADLSLSISGGTATNPTITSLTNSSDGPLVGGENVIRVNFSVTGLADGTETLTVNPANANSAFDRAGNAAEATQSNNTVMLVEDNVPPVFSSTPVTSVDEDKDYSYVITTSDGNSADVVNITATVLPDWLSLSDGQEGTVTTFAGNGNTATTDGTGTAAELGLPLDVAIDNANNLYVADFSNIRKITPAGVVTTLYTAANEVFTSLIVDATGTVFAAEGGEGAIRIVKISPSGVRSEFVGGSGSNDFGDVDGTGTTARFFGISGMAFDASGNLFVADGVNHKIRKITPAGVVTTFAGSGVEGDADGNGSSATFNFPQGLAIDRNGNLYVADTDNNKIRKITPAGVVSTLAGSGSRGAEDGGGTAASFNTPNGLAIDASGSILVADRQNHAIRKVTPSGTVTTLAGSGSGSYADGVGTMASFNRPYGLTVDSNGDIFIADGNNARIRKMVLSEPSYELTGDPLGQVGTHNVTLTADDGNGGTVTQVFIVTVVDVTPPTLSSAVKDSDTQITLTYNEKVQTNEGNPTDFILTDGQGSTFTVTRQADGTATDTDIVLTVADLSTVVGDLTITYTNNNDEISDIAGNAAATDDVGVTIDLDQTVPEVSSIVRHNPTEETVNDASVIFRVTFDEPVQNVSADGSDFSVSGDATSTGVSVSEVSTTVFDVTISGIDGNGELDLDINAGQDIADFGGNAFASTITTEETYTIDNVVPATPVISGISTDSGTDSSDEITNDNTISVSGTAEANSSVEVFIDNTSIGTAITDDSGNWAFDYSSTSLADATYRLTAKATDIAGNVSEESTALDITIDTIAPAMPEVTGISDDTGNDATDAVTNDNTLIFNGTAEANAVVELFIDGTSFGTSTTNTDGDWSFDHTGTTLNDASYAVTAKATDAAGNVSEPSNALTMVLDTELTATGFSPADGETDVLPNVNLVITFSEDVFIGTGNVIIKDESDDSVFETIDINSGNVTLSGRELTIDPVADILTPGADFYVNIGAGAIVDLAGNDLVISNTSDWNFSIIAASTVSSLAVPADNTYKIGDNLDFTVNMVLPVTVTGIPSIPVTIGAETVNATLVGTATNTSALVFRYTVVEGNLDTDGIALGSAMNLNGGSMKDQFDVDAILTLNNIASTTNVLVDGVIPDAPVVSAISDDTGTTSKFAGADEDELTNDQTLSFSGTAEANATVEVFIDGTSIGTTTANGNGNWTYDHSGTDLAEGTYDVTARATDNAGNTSEQSAALAIEVDITTPEQPTIDLDASTDLGISDTDNLTSGNTITLVGTAEPNSVVTVSLDGVGEMGDVLADGSGNWTWTETDNFASATYNLTVTTEDAAGNKSVVSETLEVVIDQDLSLSSTTPTDEEVDVLPNTNLTMTFDKSVVKGAGNITIKQLSDDSVIETIDVTGGNVTVNGTTVTIDPVDNILPPDTDFYINVDPGSFENEAGAPYAGISDNSTWNFKIIAASVVTSVAVPAANTYKIGDNLDFTVNMVLPVSISGTATVPLTIGTTAVNATQVGTVNNSNSILFRYTVLEDQLDADGVELGAAIDLNGGTMQDEFGVDALLTLNNVASTAAVQVDAIKPIPTISSSAVNLVNGTFSVNIIYNEAVANVDAADLTVVNGTAGNLQSTIAGTAWTADITPIADGAVSVILAANTANDLAGNDNKASNSISRDFDGTPPEVVSVNRTDSDPLNTGVSEANFQIVFSEAVTGLDLSDLEVVLTGTATGSLNMLTPVNSTTYNVNVSGIAGEGTIGLNVKDDDSIIDGATNPLATAFTGQIYTTNAIPTDIGLSTTSIDENNAPNALAANISTTDNDAGDSHSYSLVAGTGDTDNASFIVSGSELVVNNLSFNFEMKDSYEVRLQTDDGKGGVFEKAFVITINDINEAPVTLDLSNDVIDEADDAQEVGVFTTLDPDTGDTFTFTLVAGEGDSDNAEFVINGSTLNTNGLINFEDGPTRSIRVRVTDADGLTFERAFVITINDIVIEPLRDFDTNAPNAKVHNIFSPNGDGVNETWVIEDLLDNPINEVKVYAQGGKLIFSKVNYENDWDATFKGDPIPDGTYYYEINIYNGERILKGFLTIIRSN